MKAKIILILAVAVSGIFSPFMVKAQIVYHDASDFPLLGKISDDTETRYERLPVSLKEVSRPPERTVKLPLTEFIFPI